MKSIRNIAFSALLTMGALSAVTYTACNKDKCKDVVCQNSGVCNDGNCSCTTGYEGANCETEVRAKVLKTWTASDKKVSDGSSLPTYSSIIVKGTGVSDILISNFSDLFTNDVKASISGNTITVLSQAPDNDGYTVEGTATYNAADKTISWSYTIKNPTLQSISYTGKWQ